jgi:hypothetical protein
VRAYYRLQVLIVAGWLVSVVVPPLATVARPSLRGDLFPLSVWAMFARVHNVMDDFGLLILQIADRPLEPPRYLEEVGPGLPAGGSIEAYHAVQALGQATAAGDDGRVATLRTLVEGRYLAATPGVRYQLVRRRWDPLRRWRGHPFRSEEPLGPPRVTSVPNRP